jgi:stage II sporulation protein D
MRIRFARSAVLLLLALQTFNPIVVVCQGEVRQRRTQTATRSETTPSSSDEWTVPANPSIVSLAGSNVTKLSEEPTIRVALATDVRSATISTSGHLMNASDVATTLMPLDVARVRVEPRLLSPLPAVANDAAYQIKIVGLATRLDAEQKLRDIKEATAQDSQVAYDTESKTWQLLVGPKRSRDEAEEIRLRLEEVGFDAIVVSPDSTSSGSPSIAKSTSPVFTAQTSTRTVRPAARLSLPSREVVAFAPGAGRLFSSSAPVTFASDSQAMPVVFDDRPYRGRIEVFTNPRGALTVVNVLGLEDYVKGVVPNELSAGGYPLLEAHKAQAIAARTYALRNRGQFMSQGYDLLPTTRSQVYRGLASENALSTRAVDETRGMVATFNGEPINALYTSTCGGRTEDAANIFPEAVPYLKGRECAAEGRAALAPFIIKTNRDPAELKDEQNVSLARDVALLAIQNFSSLRVRISDSWAAAEAPTAEIRSWIASVANLARQPVPAVSEDVNRPASFASALSSAVYGESRGRTLLNDADVDYFLAVKDAADIPQANRADVAMLLRDGYLSVLPDATLRPRDPLSRARAIHSIARMLEARNLLQIQKGFTRPTNGEALVLRTKTKDQTIRMSADAFLFRQIGENVYAVRSVALVGGEAVSFHVNRVGEVDYLEVRPAMNGAAADRFSPFTNWTTELSVGQVQSRLGRAASGIGSLVDLRVIARGKSRRAIDLEVVGTDGISHVRGGRIRSALGLREQLFVIERKYDEAGRLTGFSFVGRGWGHGVGMCQVGAYGLARQGFTYDQILKAYYTGIDITTLY